MSSLALVTYPPEVKHGGEKVEIVGMLPPTATLEREKIASFVADLGNDARQVKGPRGWIDVVQKVEVFSGQEARKAADQLASRICSSFHCEARVEPTARH